MEEKRPLKRMEAYVIPVHIKDKALCTETMQQERITEAREMA